MNIESFLQGLYLPALLSSLLRTKLSKIKETNDLFSEYDYIIVGSGPGGSVIANRLSEDSNVKILLLEAGKQDNLTTEIPATNVALLGDNYDWFFETAPQKQICFDKTENKCRLSSGKVIGGSSAINEMLHTRGNKIDYDEWSEAGNKGWSYDDVLPYFKKHENFLANKTCTEDQYHGCNGELSITQLHTETERNITKSFIQGVQEIGYDVVDPSGEKQLGVFRGYYTIRNGSRVSAATAFLRPVQSRANLHIVLEAFVRKILIDPDKKLVTGVEFEKDGIVKQIKVNKEVILSAGTYSSPKILMLSGIGPKEELEKYKIPVIIDLPGVGQNLQESLATPVIAVTGKSLPDEDLSLIATKTIKQWTSKREGLLASPSGLDACFFDKAKDEKKDRADFMFILNTLPIYDLLKYLIRRAFHMNEDMWNAYYGKLTHQELFTFTVTLLRPKSKGTVTLKSNDPHDIPVIDPNYFADEDDQKKMLEGIRLAQSFVNLKPLSDKEYKLCPLVLDFCKEHKFNSDDYIKCTYRYLSFGTWGGCCTNKMGPDTDKMAVVDHRLRVKGIKGLRVVDVSIFPNQVSSLPGATIYMVSEKAASMIKEDNLKI